MRVWTVHGRPASERKAPRVVLVRDGFSWGAFLFPTIWFLWNGLIALAARTFLGPGRRAYVERPAYPVYAVATGIEGAELIDDPAEADLVWVCNPNNPTGQLVEPAEIAALARSLPSAAARGWAPGLRLTRS